MQITAMEPKRLLMCRLPHVSLLAFPWARVFGRIRAQSPNLSYLVSDLPRDQVRGPAVHRTVAGGVNDEISRQLGPIAQDDRMLREFFDIDAALESDAAIGNQFRSTNIDVVSGPAPQVFHEQARVVVTIIEQEACLLQTLVVIGIAFPDRVIDRDLELVQNLVG